MSGKGSKVKELIQDDKKSLVSEVSDDVQAEINLFQLHRAICKGYPLRRIEVILNGIDSGACSKDKVYKVLVVALSYYDKTKFMSSWWSRWPQRLGLFRRLSFWGADVSYHNKKHLLYSLLSKVDGSDLNNKDFLLLVDMFKEAGLGFDESADNNCVDIYFNKLKSYYNIHPFNASGIDVHFAPIISRIDAISMKSIDQFFNSFDKSTTIRSSSCWLRQSLKQHHSRLARSPQIGLGGSSEKMAILLKVEAANSGKESEQEYTVNSDTSEPSAPPLTDTGFTQNMPSVTCTTVTTTVEEDNDSEKLRI